MVHCLCDNAAVVAILKSGTSRHGLVMHLMRYLLFFIARHQLCLHQSTWPVASGGQSVMWQPASLPAARTQVQPATNPAAQGAATGTGGAEARLDSGGLAECAAFYFAQGLADSSIRTYWSGQKRYPRYLKFCEQSNMSPLPLSEQILCNFVAHLADEHLKHHTVKMYLSGLHFLQIKAGLSDPFQARVYVMPNIHFTRHPSQRGKARFGKKGAPADHTMHFP